MRKQFLLFLLLLVWLLPRAEAVGGSASVECEGGVENHHSPVDDLALQSQQKTFKMLGVMDEAGAVVNGTGITTLLAKWNNLTIDEAKSLYTQLVKTEIQGSKVVRTQAEILLDVQQRGITNSYNFAFPIEDFNLSKDAVFVRVHNSWNPNRPWLISIEEFKTFTSQDDLIKKLALPIIDNTGNVIKPAEISIVKLPAGTKVRKSVARPQDWPGQGHQPGGALQFEITGQPAKIEWFKKIGNLSDYLN